MAKLYGPIKKYYEERKHDPDFVVTGIVVEILDNLCKRMKEKGIDKRELANRLGKHVSYVTRLLQGDYDNLTIKDLVKLAFAIGEKPESIFDLARIFGDEKQGKGRGKEKRR